MKININNNRNISNIYFQAKITPPKQLAIQQKGSLSSETRRNLNSIASSYKDIRNKLNCKTEEGLKYIRKNFPNISIGDGLIFHNCGEIKSSIVIKCAESLENSGLMKIIERKSGTSWGEGIVLNSFLLDNNQFIIKNTEENKLRSFPKNREYYTDKELKDLKSEERLSRIINDLDSAMLEFRKFILPLDNQYKKAPDGVLPYIITSTFREIQIKQKELDSILSKLPKKVELEVRKTYPNYKLITGLTTHAFKDIGENNYSLTYYPITAPGYENLRRLNIFDENNNLIRTFAVTTDGKMVSNLYQNSTIHLPDKLNFFNESDLFKEENCALFQKYLQAYSEQMSKLLDHAKKTYLERLKYMNSLTLETSLQTQEDINLILTEIAEIENNLKVLPATKNLEFRKQLPNLKAMSSKKGIKITGYEDGKEVSLFPISSGRHDNLTKISIKDINGKEHFYILKDLKYIVKNINPQYPQMMPKRLIFLTEADNDVTPEIQNVLNHIKKQLSEYTKLTSEEISNFEKLQTENSKKQEIKAIQVQQQREDRIKIKKQKKEEALLIKENKKAEKERIKQEKIKSREKEKQEEKDYKKFNSELVVFEQILNSTQKHLSIITDIIDRLQNGHSIPKEEFEKTMSFAQKLGITFDKLNEGYKALLERFEITK